MTDQYTPTTQTVERTYVTYGRVDGPLHPEERRAEFFRWLTAHDESIRAEEREDIAAAEQRGAIKALRDAAEDTRGHELSAPDDWLLDRADRIADQIEGDDE